MLTNVSGNVQRLPLAAFILLELLAAIDVSGVTVLVPTLQSDFSLSNSQTSWILSAYLLPFAIFIVPLGVLIDRLNIPQRMLRLSALGFALGSLTCALSDNMWIFFFARAVKGVCAAGIFTSQFTIILKYWRHPHRAVEIVLIGTAVGLFLGPLLGAWTAHALWWRLFFGAGTIVALIAAASSMSIDKMVPVLGKESIPPEKFLFAESVKTIFKSGAWGFVLHFVLSFSLVGANLIVTIHLQQTMKAAPDVNGWALATVAAGMAFQNVAGIGSRFFRTVDRAAVIGVMSWGGLLAALAFRSSLCDSPAIAIYFFLGMALGLALSAVDIVILEKVPVQRLALASALITMVMQGAMALSVEILPLLYWHFGLHVLVAMGLFCVIIGGIAVAWQLHAAEGES
ncbi:MAG: MFS transporter [Deltaproteobacteria bacterium]|nr:MFS transporter [Deltaproteobacteria bacterium]